MPYGDTTPGMIFGSVAMIDALGFKGIWTEKRSQGKWTPQDVISKMSGVKQIADEQRKSILENFPALDANVDLGVRTIMVSDTLLVFTYCIPRDIPKFIPDPKATDAQNQTLENLTKTQWHLSSFACLKLCVEIVGRAVGAALIDMPELNFRGAITVGDYALGKDEPFYLGPAIDDCADAFERPKGAFVIFCQQAKEFYEEGQRRQQELKDTAASINFDIEDYSNIVSIPDVILHSVPCKKTPTEECLYETYVLNPLAKWRKEDWQDRSNKIIELMEGDSASIKLYRENTAAFLDKINAENRDAIKTD